jgi:DUF971 family protein
MRFPPEATTPTKIKKLSPGELQLLWKDGHETRHLAPLLRGLCPCATCKDEMTGVRIVLPIHIPDSLQFKKIELVGNYAVQFEFTDDHHTGIYSFEYLRELCACPDCRAISKENHPGSR